MTAEGFAAIVVGGGLYGCALAIHLRKELGLAPVLLLEREAELLKRASWANQARVHNGYHYPRSFLTGLRSRVNYPRFLADYPECVDERDTHYYAVGRVRSKVTAHQYERFCERIGAPLEPAGDDVRAWFDPGLVEAVFRGRECVFDADRLAERLRKDLTETGVDLRLGREASAVTPGRGDDLVLGWRGAGEEGRATAPWVFNCTYSRLNGLQAAAGWPRLELKHELTEMAVVEVPEELSRVGVTLM